MYRWIGLGAHSRIPPNTFFRSLPVSDINRKNSVFFSNWPGHDNIRVALLAYASWRLNHTPWPADQYFSVQNHERNTRRAVNRPTMLLAQPMCKTSRFQNDFFQRCVNAWNSLPNDVVDSSSVSSFKHKLETVDLSNYLSYRF